MAKPSSAKKASRQTKIARRGTSKVKLTAPTTRQAVKEHKANVDERSKQRALRERDKPELTVAQRKQAVREIFRNRDAGGGIDAMVGAR